MRSFLILCCVVCFAPIFAGAANLTSVASATPDSSALGVLPGGEAREQFLMGKVALEGGKSDEALRYFIAARSAVKDSNSATAKGISIYISMVYFYNQNYVDCYNTGYKAISVLPPGGFQQKFERMLLKAKMEVLAEHRKMEAARQIKEAEQKRLEEQQKIEAEQKIQAQIEAERLKAAEEERLRKLNADSWNEYQKLATDYPPLDVAFTGNPIHNEAAIYFTTNGLPNFKETDMQAFRNWQTNETASAGYWVFRGSWGEKNIDTKWSVDSIIYLPGKIHRVWMLGFGYGSGINKHNGFVGDWDVNVTKVVQACPSSQADCGLWYSSSQLTAYDIAVFELNFRWQYRFPNAWDKIVVAAGMQGGFHTLITDSEWHDVILSKNYSGLAKFISDRDVIQSFIPKSAPAVLTFTSNGAFYLDYKLILELGVNF